MFLLILNLVFSIHLQALSLDEKSVTDQLNEAKLRHDLCVKTTGGTTFALFSCAQAYQVELDTIHVKLIKDLQISSPNEEEKVVNERYKKANATWIAFREANCKAIAADAIGGSLEKILVADCWNEMTDARVRELDSSYNFGEL